jgi:hypothetical protein
MSELYQLFLNKLTSLGVADQEQCNNVKISV